MADNKKSIWVDVSVSPGLKGNDLDSIMSGIEIVKKGVESIDPEGRVVVFVAAKKDKFSPVETLAANLSKLRLFYNERVFMKDPEIAQEFAEVAEHISKLNKLIEKRKRKNQKRRQKNIMEAKSNEDNKETNEDTSAKEE